MTYSATATPPPASPLAGLDPDQMAAVTAPIGPTLVAAGPGSGKTRVLAARCAWMLHGGIEPSTVCAFTFTNKAAKELRSRVQAAAGEPGQAVWAGTFHSFGARLLREYADRIGLNPKFAIYDRDDSNSILRKCLEEIPPPPGPAQPYARNNPRRNRRNPPGGPVTLAQASRYIDRQKHGNQHPNYDATAPDHAGQHETVLPWLYARYQERLDQAQACDFNDLVLLPVRVLEQNAEIARSIREIFQHVLVDEYQDVNRNQAKLAQLVADPDPDHASIYVVGDPDQAIYGFQHADVGNILRFASVQHPAARRYHLNNNYRSVPAVINAANRLIRHNRQRIDRESTPARSDHADAAIRIRGYANPEAEAKALAQLIKEAHESTRQVPYGHWCVAYRANRQSRALEEALRAAGVPVKIQGAYEFFKRQEIVIAVSYLRLARNPADYAALERVMNTPRRSLGDAAKNRLGRYAVLKTAHRLDQAVRAAAWEPEAFAAAQEDQKPLSAAATRGCQQLSQALDQLTELGAQDAAPGIILEYVYRGGECDLENYARQMPAAGESRWDNLTELENLANAGDYGPGTLEQFLQRVQLDPPDAEAEQAEQDGDEPPDRVSISTLHQTKGLEFPRMVIAGASSREMPGPAARQPTALEEERRVFYVGCTRAKDRLYVSWHSAPPTRFLQECGIDTRTIK